MLLTPYILGGNWGSVKSPHYSGEQAVQEDERADLLIGEFGEADTNPSSVPWAAFTGPMKLALSNEAVVRIAGHEPVEIGRVPGYSVRVVGCVLLSRITYVRDRILVPGENSKDR